jgi:hypothetical protein
VFQKKFTKMLILLTLCAIFLASFPSITLAQETILYVNPSSETGLEIGDTFQINITVSDVVDLYAWEFSLFYKNAILNVTSIIEGPFLLAHPDPGASTMFGTAPDTTEAYNATHGLIHLYNTLIGVHGGVAGTGTLATINFKVKGEGDCLLALRETKLVDSAEPFGNLIPHTTTDGIVHVGLHDIAITNTETSKTVTNDTIVYINVTVENQGKMAETFNVTTYYDSTPIETKTVMNLPEGTSAVITLTWDTTPIQKGNYTITTLASIMLGETDIADNTYIDGWVLETIMGDVNGDGRVNIVDISLVAVSFKTEPGDTKWNPNADVNNDNEINIIDMSKVAIHYGEVGP